MNEQNIDSQNVTQKPIIKNNTRRAKNLLLIIPFLILVEVLILILAYMQYVECAEVHLAEPRYGQVDIEPSKHLDTLKILRFIFSIAYWLFLIQWFRRAYNNLHLLKLNQMSFGEGWAAGGWFIPIVNFIVPYKIMRETWVNTIEILKKGKEDLVIKTAKYWEVGINLWWSFWIISIIGSMAYRTYTRLYMSYSSALAKKCVIVYQFNITSIAAKIIACLLLMFLVKRFSTLEKVLYEKQWYLKKVNQKRTNSWSN